MYILPNNGGKYVQDISSDKSVINYITNFTLIISLFAEEATEYISTSKQ